MNSDKKRQKRILLYSGTAFLFLITAVLLIQRYRIKNELDQHKAQTALHVAQRDSMQAFIRLQQIDELLFTGNFDEAQKLYETLLSDTSRIYIADAYMERRLNFVRTQQRGISSRAELESSLPSPRRQDTIPEEQALRPISGSDSVRKSQRSVSDSLESTISRLNRQLNARERALEEKENVKAAAIQRADGLTIQYVGDTRNGMAHGKGTGIWESSGGTYKGAWHNNNRHGYGVYTWKDGVRYEGDFREDKREGKGSYFWPSGERYVGQWKDNQRHGHGILYDKDGNISYQGNWEKDKPKKK